MPPSGQGDGCCGQKLSSNYSNILSHMFSINKTTLERWIQIEFNQNEGAFTSIRRVLRPVPATGGTGTVPASVCYSQAGWSVSLVSRETQLPVVGRAIGQRSKRLDQLMADSSN
jgi:hypothetical protein